MNFEIHEENENPLLNRKEIKATVSFAGATPSREQVRQAAIGQLKSKPELTILACINQKFGKNTAQVYVKVYQDEKALAIEPAYIMKRNFPPKKEGGEEKAQELEQKPEEEKPKAEQKAQDKPKEEKGEVAKEPEKQKEEEKAPAEDKKEEDAPNKTDEKEPAKEEAKPDKAKKEAAEEKGKEEAEK